MIEPITESDIDERLGRAFFPRRRVDARVNEGQLDIAQAIGARQQVECLKNETDLLVPDRGELVVVHLGNVPTIEVIAARCWRIETTEIGRASCRERV